MEPKLSAKECLERLLGGKDFDYWYNRMMARMAEGDKIPENLKTKEGEILNIRKEVREQSAKTRLALLETGKHDFPYHSEKMLAELEDAGIAPEKIGVTVDKLYDLKILWAKNRVVGIIKSVGLGGGKDYNFGLISKFLESNGLNLGDVDLNEGIIRELLHEAHRHYVEQPIVLAPKEAKGKSPITAILAIGQ